jgi:peptide/nickel transport system substrate-binding protein
VNTEPFEGTVGVLAKNWGDIGIPVDIKKFESSDLTQTLIRPRKYDMLLFGTAIGRELDFYSFWHSSQRNDPGLNVGLYANITTDALLESARSERNPDVARETYTKFAHELRSEVPALFLYVPEFTYIIPKKIENASFTGLSQAHERFSGIEGWFTDTEAVWEFFTTNNGQTTN